MSTIGTNSAIPAPAQSYSDRGYGAASTPRAHPQSHTINGGGPAVLDYAPNDHDPHTNIPNSHGRFNEEWDASQRGSSIIDGNMHRSHSVMSQGDTLIPSRGGTLKKKASLKRSGSRRSSRAGSVRSLVVHPQGDIDEAHSAFYSPVPTSGNPTDILANRFQAWRKVLKDLIVYFKEIQSQYEHRSKSLLKVSNVINNTTAPAVFLPTGGIDDALQILRNYHKSAIAEANKSRDIEQDVILALTGLRSDLQQKIKEIKGLSGDFKNSVDKEMEATRKAVAALQDGLGQSDIDPSQMTGKHDPYLLRLAVDRQVEKQIDEENYLHQAYLNLEASGRELEAIVVGEIQKSYNALAGILKREADSAYSAVDELRTGPIAMPKDHEWTAFVENDEHFIDPKVPIRTPEIIRYPGQDNELAGCIREGLLERKSKFLKRMIESDNHNMYRTNLNSSAGWYVLSPTHLHEFRSADKLGAPIMSLYLPEQKLGSHSNEGGSSNKFILKGRQTGALHRGHSWVFRAETRDTLLAWYEDIKTLTEKSPQERNAFVRQHARSVSGTSQRAGSISSDGVMDEEDEEPFSAHTSAIVGTQGLKQEQKRPEPGGRFPSDLQINATRGLQAPLSPSSGSSIFGGEADDAVITAAALPASGVGHRYGETPGHASPTHAQMINQAAEEDGVNPYTYEPIQNMNTTRDSQQHELPTTAATAGLGGAALGIAGTAAYHDHQLQKQREQADMEATMIAAPDTDRLREQADMEAAMIAAPDDHIYDDKAQQQADLETTAIAAPDTHMSGGRSQGDISAVPWFNEVGETAAISTVAATTAVPTTSTVTDTIEPRSMEALLDPLAKDLERPTLAAGQNHQSVQSISQLHVPGEFPRTRTETGSSLSNETV
ncbi:putative ph domain-containing protein [Botrytis fragariae]|uniref:Putative ph domain-containing protein n=1 Tax=Botrytis fragariae TaxID=1964551 RepID=A0A8H6AZL8_9HELO|nr:putative ph domain-containing protein [Botrytis fragariae]KAF5876523.1 putative ph domain-containing protein [Botrytis fragariae]